MNNSNGKASLKRQKSPETKTDIVFLLCARVGWCDVCTDFINVIKVDDVNNSDGKASLKRQKSPETTRDTQGMSKFY